MVFVLHRLPTTIEALNQGYEIHVATGISDQLDVLRYHGLIVHLLAIGRSNAGGEDEADFSAYLAYLQVTRPNIVHLVTIKWFILSVLLHAWRGSLQLSR